MDIDVDTKGPIFIPGLPESVMRSAVHDIEEDLGEEGARMVRANLDGVLKHPTGFYRSNVTYEGDRITDNNVVYGPWLEGVGSRNRTTRFKGYFTFRRTTQELDRRSGQIAEDTLDPFIRRLS
jgi:hypothetical protein